MSSGPAMGAALAPAVQRDVRGQWRELRLRELVVDLGLDEPGLIAFTQMPNSPRWRASDTVSPRTAPFDAG